MSQQVSLGESAPAGPSAAPRVTLGRVATEVFGPRPVESGVWGLGIGLVFGMPLMLAYFVAHFWGVQVQLELTGIGMDPGFDDATYQLLFWIGFTVLGFGLIGTAGLSVLVALLRRACFATIALVAFLVGLVPYLLFFLLFITGQ